MKFESNTIFMFETKPGYNILQGALNKNIEKIIEIGRLKGDTVRDAIK